jgi:selenocysteine lyase/cysteine desulfurase
VLCARENFLREVEVNPDVFFRRDIRRRWRENLTLLAPIVNAENVDDLVFVPNATTGCQTAIQTVVHKARLLKKKW